VIIIGSSLCLCLPLLAVAVSKEISDGLVVILIVPHQVVTSTLSSAVRLMVAPHCLVVLTIYRKCLCYEQQLGLGPCELRNFDV